MEYCTELMDISSKCGVEVLWMILLGGTRSETAWEPRILAILPKIKDQSINIDLVLEVLRRCSIPWSTDIQTLIDNTLNCTSRRVQELQEQYDLMKLKLMLLRYGIQNADISDIVSLKGTNININLKN